MEWPTPDEPDPDHPNSHDRDAGGSETNPAELMRLVERGPDHSVPDDDGDTGLDGSATPAESRPDPRHMRQIEQRFADAAAEPVPDRHEHGSTDVDFDVDPDRVDRAERREQVLDRVTTTYGIEDPDKIAAVERAFDATYTNLAPIIVHATDEILDRSRTIIEQRPDTTVVFVGRDGYPEALAARALAPDLFDSHCRMATISRTMAETGVQDWEQNGFKDFPHLADFRDVRDQVDPAEVPGFRAAFGDYLEARGIPVNTPGSTIILVDSGRKGTVQELLSAAFPSVNFIGLYLAHAEVKSDPHPNTKFGILLHQDHTGAVKSRDAAVPPDVVPLMDDGDYLRTLEQALRGPLSSAKRISAELNPVQQLDPPDLDRINPQGIAPAYLDGAVALAVLEANQRAVAEYALDVAQRRRDGTDTTREVAAAAGAGLDQLRSWAVRDPSNLDPGLAQMLNSTVRRRDEHLVSQLRATLRDHGPDPGMVGQIWRKFGELRSLEEKEQYVDDLRTLYTQGDNNG